MLSFVYATKLIFIGLNFRKPSFKTWSSNLRFYFIALVYIVEIYGNFRAMFLTEIQIRQLIINICHLFGVFMVTFVLKVIKLSVKRSNLFTKPRPPSDIYTFSMLPTHSMD